VNLDLVARQPQTLLRRSPVSGKLSNVAWNKAAFIVFWEGQGHLSSLAYVALVAFASIWIALGAMFVWSVAATLVFCAARERGYPNLLSEMSLSKRKAGNFASYAFVSVVRAALAGINAFIYARCSGFLLAEKQGCCRARRFARIFAIGLGLTLFGVSTAEHLLRSAGYSGGRLVRMSLLGPVLHVPYRVLLSAALVAVLTDALNRLQIVRI
jgi:hypothetical protein